MMKFKISLHFLMLKTVKNHSLVHGNNIQLIKSIYVQWKTNVKNTSKLKL